MVESGPFRCGRPRAVLRTTVRGRLTRLMPESVLISLGETPLRRCTRRKGFPSGRVGEALDLAAGHFLNLLNQLAVVEHAVDRLLYEFEDQGLLLFAHVALLDGVPCVVSQYVLCNALYHIAQQRNVRMPRKPKQLDLSKPKTDAITMRFSAELKELAETAAKDDHRSLSQYIEKLVIEHLRAKGYMK